MAETTQTPSIESSDWELLALVGDVGPTGETGQPGAQGATGPAGPGFSNGDAKGDIKYWDGSSWKNLGPGTIGQVLTVGENDDLEWTDK